MEINYTLHPKKVYSRSNTTDAGYVAVEPHQYSSPHMLQPSHRHLLSVTAPHDLAPPSRTTTTQCAVTSMPKATAVPHGTRCFSIPPKMASTHLPNSPSTAYKTPHQLPLHVKTPPLNTNHPKSHNTSANQCQHNKKKQEESVASRRFLKTISRGQRNIPPEARN
jgi:hypothetical protein